MKFSKDVREQVIEMLLNGVQFDGVQFDSITVEPVSEQVSKVVFNHEGKPVAHFDTRKPFTINVKGSIPVSLT